MHSGYIVQWGNDYRKIPIGDIIQFQNDVSDSRVFEVSIESQCQHHGSRRSSVIKVRKTVQTATLVNFPGPYTVTTLIPLDKEKKLEFGEVSSTTRGRVQIPPES